MKRLAYILTGCVFAMVVFASQQTISTNSIVLFPKKPIQAKFTDAWVASTVYAQGTVVKNLPHYYFAVAGGTSGTNVPVHTSGEVSDSSMTWRWITPSTRNGLFVSMRTASGRADISLSTSSAAVATNAFPLINEGHTLIFTRPDYYQGGISAIRTFTNDVVLSFGEF